MSEIFSIILVNLSYIGVVLALIGMFQMANMFFGLVDNVFEKNEKFEWNKIVQWLVRSGVFLFGVAALTTGVSILPYIVQYVGVNIPAEYGEVITMALIIAASYKAVVREMTKAYEHFKNIINED